MSEELINDVFQDILEVLSRHPKEPLPQSDLKRLAKHIVYTAQQFYKNEFWGTPQKHMEENK